MILYNGQTGGLGRHFEKALTDVKLPFAVQNSRLEDQDGFKKELAALQVKDKSITLVQMAALVPIAESEKNPQRAHKTNVTDTLVNVSTFCRWAQEMGLTTRVLYVSTGHVYGVDGRSISESSLPQPQSVYAKTKWQAEKEILAYQKKNPRVKVLIARVFGLVGIDQPPHYVLPSLIRRAKENDFSPVPGLSFLRDYLDTRDVCRLIAELCGLDWKDSLINVCSGKPVTIRDMFLLVLKELHFPSNIGERLKEAPGRPNDLRTIVGNPQRLINWLKKEPQTIPLRQTIADALAS